MASDTDETCRPLSSVTQKWPGMYEASYSAAEPITRLPAPMPLSREVASMKVAVVKETAPGERRVALIPDAVAKLRAAGRVPRISAFALATRAQLGTEVHTGD